MTHRCSAAARWLPRLLAGAILAAGTLVALRIDPHSTVSGSRVFRTLLVVTAAVAALWVVRRGAELRVAVAVAPEGLLFGAGSRELRLRFEEIAAMRYEPAFGASRSWLPAAVLVDRDGRSWRLSGLLAHGERLTAEILSASGRQDLASWVEAHRIDRRMAGAARRTGVGYFAALAILGSATLFYLRPW